MHIILLTGWLTGYTGVVCGECADGYGISPQGTCSACTDEGITWVGIAVIAVVGSIMLVGLVIFILRRLSRHERQFHERALELFGESWLVWPGLTVNYVAEFLKSTCLITSPKSGNVIPVPKVQDALEDYIALKAVGKLRTPLPSKYDDSCVEEMTEHLIKQSEQYTDSCMDYTQFCEMLECTRDSVMAIKMVSHTYKVQYEKEADREIQVPTS